MVEETQAHFSDTHAGSVNVWLGDWQQNLDAKDKAINALRKLQGIVQDVLVHMRDVFTHGGVASGTLELQGQESLILERINKSLLPDSSRRHASALFGDASSTRDM